MGSNTAYFHWQFILISLPNLIVIALLIGVFALAVVLRRPGERPVSTIEGAPVRQDRADEGPGNQEDIL